MYSKDPAVDSEDPVWSKSSFLPSGCSLTLSKSKLHSNKICEKDSEEYMADLETVLSKAWAIWQMELRATSYFF